MIFIIESENDIVYVGMEEEDSAFDLSISFLFNCM